MTYGFNYTLADTEQKATLLDCYEHRDGKFIYAQAGAAIAKGEICKIDNDGQAVLLDTTVSGAEPTACGIPQVALANDEYGWFWCKGGGLGRGIVVKALTLCAANVKIYTTATAGAVDDSVTDLIAGLTICTTNALGTTALAEVYSPIEICTNCQD